MAEKILYILGAGASANALPLAKTALDKETGDILIDGLASALNKVNLDKIFLPVEHNNANNYDDMKNRFKWLSGASKVFGDVDTFAKYLHINQPGGEQIQRLKKTLAEFFIIKQVLEKEIDHRYLPWLVGLLSNKRFPEHVKILSWNYDFQLQIAGQYFGELEKVAHTTNASHYQPGFINYFPNLDYSPSDVYSLIHLNGIAGYETSSSVFHSADREQVVNQLLSDTATYHNAIHFAWDGSRYHDTLMKDVIKMIDGVTILVVIGYSFPFYNRKVDAGIFKSIHTHGKLKKIYYQDPYLTGSQLPAMFSLPESLNIVHIKNKDNFHIPFEY